MYAPLLIAVLFLIGVAWNLFSPEGSPAHAVDGAMIVVLLLVAAWFIHREEMGSLREIERLLEQVRCFRAEGDIEGVENTMATLLRTYTFVFSCLLTAMTFQTRYLPAKSPKRWWFLVWSSVLTLIFGWWALPEGPFRTISTVINNITGGEIKTLQQVVAEVMNSKGSKTSEG